MSRPAACRTVVAWGDPGTQHFSLVVNKDSGHKVRAAARIEFVAIPPIPPYHSFWKFGNIVARPGTSSIDTGLHDIKDWTKWGYQVRVRSGRGYGWVYCPLGRGRFMIHTPSNGDNSLSADTFRKLLVKQGLVSQLDLSSCRTLWGGGYTCRDQNGYFRDGSGRKWQGNYVDFQVHQGVVTVADASN